MIHPALRMLIGMRVHGAVRASGRIAALFTALIFLLPWLSPRASGASRVHLPGETRFAIAIGGALLTAASLLLGRGRTTTLEPAETDLLLGGPFTGRQVVAYKVVLTALGATWPALLFALLYGRTAVFPVALLGLWLLFATASLLAMLLDAAWSSRNAWTRVALLALPAAAAVELLAFLARGDLSLAAFGASVARDVALRSVLLPFECAARTYLARPGPGLALWGTLGIGVVAIIVAAILRLHGLVIAHALAAREGCVQRTRRRHAGRGPRAVASLRRLTLGMPPPLRGIGPVVWVRAMQALRAPGRTAMVAGLVAAASLAAVFLITPLGSRVLLLGAVVLVLVMAPEPLAFDFRASTADLDVWKALPMSPIRLAIAQLTVPVLLLTVLGGGALAAASVRSPLAAYAPIAALFLPIVALLAVGLENALFLLFPGAHLQRAETDPLAAAKGILLLGARLVVWTAIVLGADVARRAVTMLTASWTAGACAAWLGVALAAGGSVVVVAGAFETFDTSRDVPPQ